MTCDRLIVFSGHSVSSTNKIDRHDKTEILLKVMLSILTLTITINIESTIVGFLHCSMYMCLIVFVVHVYTCTYKLKWKLDLKKTYILSYMSYIISVVSKQTEAGEEQLLNTKQKIHILSDETAHALKQNVYRNYSQFIETAKEISSKFFLACHHTCNRLYVWSTYHKDAAYK